MKTEIPITRHPKLPDEVPLVADFHDDRNRLSYYLPLLREVEQVRTPITKFFSVDGSLETTPDIEYREITAFLQDQQMNTSFVRGDFSSAKFNGNDGSKITSHDPVSIETTVLEMIRQLARSQRHLGGRIAVREWIPHDIEVRFFIRDGEIYCAGSEDSDDELVWPWVKARQVARSFDKLAWSCDFIRHRDTGRWYCIDMGLDGLYHNGSEWVAISGYHDESMSPQAFADEMPENTETLIR